MQITRWYKFRPYKLNISTGVRVLSQALPKVQLCVNSHVRIGRVRENFKSPSYSARRSLICWIHRLFSVLQCILYFFFPRDIKGGQNCSLSVGFSCICDTSEISNSCPEKVQSISVAIQESYLLQQLSWLKWRKCQGLKYCKNSWQVKRFQDIYRWKRCLIYI